MNQKAVKKQFSMITSKDDSTTASLLGFAIANRVDLNSANRDDPGETSKGSSTKAAKDETKESKDVPSKDKTQGKESDKEPKSRKLKNLPAKSKESSTIMAKEHLSSNATA